MTFYAFFRFHSSELIDTLNFEYVDDLDALDAARRLCNEHTVEVYDAARFVARVKQGDEPINLLDAPSGDPMSVVEETARRVEGAAEITQGRIRQSDLCMAHTWDAVCHSREAVKQSKEILAAMTKQRPSPWDPNNS